MANSYIEVGWTNSPDTKTAINATNLGHMDGGIAENRELISQLEGQNVALDERVTYIEENGVTGSGGSSSGLEPEGDDIPKVFIDGEIPTSKTEVLAELKYISKTSNFHAYITIKCRGDSSMDYDKKNFTVKMFSDETRETKLKKEFKGWGKHNKFALNANYIDHTHARNIVAAKIWSQIVASRSDYTSLPEGLINSPNNGAIEGFPIKLYNNGTYQGIYTWNIPKDDWLYGIDEDDANQFVLYGQHNTDGVYAETANNFRALWDGVSQANGQWEVEVGTNSDIVKTALNNVISLCMNADDETFESTLNNYLDRQSALDYYIFCYALCSLDSLAQNMILVSYNGTKLYCSVYDLDAILGLWWNGTKFVSTSYQCPEDYQEPYSLLWERIEALCGTELKTRYFQLRETVLSISNMYTLFERFMDVIGKDLYEEDLEIYTGIPSGSTNNITQLRNYIRDRLAYCDEQFEAMSDVILVPSTGISLSQSTLTITSEDDVTLTATLSPSDSTDAVTWESSNTSIATVVGGVVTPVANGTCEITATATSGVYAVCTVSVTGFAEPVPATNITLNQTSLSFTDETPITLTATVTPSDTTESVVWTTDDESVATVENGIVTPTGNGSCVITATAGSVSATCEVSIVDVFEIWTNTAIYGIDATTGKVKTSGDAYLSCFMEVADDVYAVTLQNANGATYIWKELYAYDSNKEYLGKSSSGTGGDGGTTSASVINKEIFPQMKYIRATAYPNGVSTNNDPNNQLEFIFVLEPETVNVELTSGITIKAEDGTVGSGDNALGSEEYIAIKDGYTVVTLSVTDSSWNSVAFYDSNKTYISGKSVSASSNMEIPTDAKFIRVSIFNGTETQISIIFS